MALPASLYCFSDLYVFFSLLYKKTAQKANIFCLSSYSQRKYIVKSYNYDLSSATGILNVCFTATYPNKLRFSFARQAFLVLTVPTVLFLRSFYLERDIHENLGCYPLCIKSIFNVFVFPGKDRIPPEVPGIDTFRLFIPARKYIAFSFRLLRNLRSFLRSLNYPANNIRRSGRLRNYNSKLYRI